MQYNNTKLANMDAKKRAPKGYKKGDMALTVFGLLKLCDWLGIKYKHYSHTQIEDYRQQLIINNTQNLDEEMLKYVKQKIADNENTRSLKANNDLVLKDQTGKVTKWDKITWPCIVGVNRYDFCLTKDKMGYDDEKIKKFIDYNMLGHWIFMPDKNTVWTWGEKTNVTNQNSHDYDADNSIMLPMEVIEIGK